MKYLVGIPYVNHPDLLYLAVNSIKLFWPQTIIIDNSKQRDLRHDKQLPSEIPVYYPPVPLTFSQTMNLLQLIALEQQCQVLMFMHNDAEAHPGTPEAFLAVLQELQVSGRKWGMVQTNYDTLAAFSMKAVMNVGIWDTVLPQYFADIDYYRRMQLAGYEFVGTGLGVTHHNNGSSTIKSDSDKMFLHQITCPLYEHYYEAKWGGKIGAERFNTPFNR